MTRPRGYAPWRPHGATKELLDNVHAVLTEYRAHLPMTLRQVFYRLVGNHEYDKTEAAYAALCDKMNRARRAGLIHWHAIRDDRPTIDMPYGYDNVADYLATVGHFLDPDVYRRHRRHGQATQLYVACEASGMVPMLARATRQYGVTVISSGGFDSVTMKRELARASITWPITVLHIGDHDPSGVHIFQSFAEDVGAFADADGGSVNFQRVAVLPEHIDLYTLPTAPPKTTDRRAFHGQTVQAEALPPDLLVDLVVQAVIDHTEPNAMDHLLAIEAAERHELDRLLAPLRAQLHQEDA